MVVCHVTPASRLALDVVCSGVGHQFLAALADDFRSAVAVGPVRSGNRRSLELPPRFGAGRVDRPVVLGTDRSGRNGGSRSVPAAGSGRVGGGLSVGRSPDVVVPPRQCPPRLLRVMVSPGEPSLCLLRWCVRYGHWRRRGGDRSGVDLRPIRPLAGRLAPTSPEGNRRCRERKAMGSALTATATSAVLVVAPVGLFGGEAQRR